MRTFGLSFALIVFALSACKEEPDERTNAEFTAPDAVKRNELVEIVASYKRGSNGKPLSYRWSLDKTPPESNAALESIDTQSTRFTTDMLGEYVVTLVVDDGRNQSAPVTHRIEAKNAPPVALVAELPRGAELGQLIQLDASGSSDCDGDPLTFRWYFDHLPEGSNAELSDPNVVNPTFVPDVPGLYAPRVVAFDGHEEGEPHGVFIWAGTNEPPIAVAPDDIITEVGQTVMLDGSASHDPDPTGDLLTYRWQLMDKPAASRVVLAAADQRKAELTPDVPGDYLIQLVVKDEFGVESAPDQVRITAR